jgi:hypothetical protein
MLQSEQDAAAGALGFQEQGLSNTFGKENKQVKQDVYFSQSNWFSQQLKK